MPKFVISVSYLALFPFFLASLAHAHFPPQEGDQPKPSSCEILLGKDRLIFGKPIQFWIDKSDAEVARLTDLYRASGVEFDVVRIKNSPFDTIIFRPSEISQINRFAKYIFDTKGQLKLATSPALFSAIPSAGAAYQDYEGILPSIERSENPLNDLELLGRMAVQEHTFVVDPLLAEKLHQDALLVRHELDHSRISAQRIKSGSDLLGARGIYSENYPGPSYFGFLNIEEIRVKLFDVIALAQKVTSSRFPGLLSKEELSRLSTMDVFKTDKERVTAMVAELSIIRSLAVGAYRASEAFNANPGQPEFFTHRNQVWARIKLEIPNKDNSKSSLVMTVPLPRSAKDVKDPSNTALLRAQMTGIGVIGLSVYHLVDFSDGVINELQSGRNQSLFHGWIQLLSSINGFKSLAHPNGSPIESQEHIDNLLKP